MKKKTKTTTAITKKCNVALNHNYLRASSVLQLPLMFVPLISLLVVLLLPAATLAEKLKVVYAVNAGGEEHVDRNSIHYDADPLRVGIASDYGKHLLMIGRVHEQDEVLYRTERYHTTTFGYDLPTDGDGDYALIMKFCEVYFDAPNRKVFDVVLNRKHTVVRQLDIYNQVGRGTAHDEIIYFKISNGRLQYKREESDVRNGILRLEFIKGALDNPKINAFALLKGDVLQMPLLPVDDRGGFAAIDEDELEAVKTPPTRQQQAPAQRAPDSQQQQPERIVRYHEPNDDELDEDDDVEVPEEGDFVASQEQQQQQQQQQQHHHQHQQTQNAKRVLSGPRQPNPYSKDDSSILLPVFIAIGAFIPLLFCLCKL